ncbi:hypothetical protein A374_04259 [Fictibacillus macauensis ZFHKF-1]|uniref:CBS domain-containing protein n=1 Tax=Fictibacillus macauensis ZFHKF-1 TaxID=1196324 RepID=I8J4P9_9BACL|nr:cyclic di-AMP binding protein CbpA [Fictibacillus macauensis]EIT86756.1 hypothetical protein A374_04259 [Fictibacillus macauensis ZFHKF-1]
MKIKSHYIPKTKVTYVTEKTTIAEARHRLIESGYRCIPVLDESETHFRGLIYKESTSDYIIDGVGSLTEPVTSLLKEQDSFINEETPFYQALFSIRRLPFLAVVNEQHVFLGILTHSKVMDIIEDSYGLKKGGYALTVSTTEGKGSLRKLFAAIPDDYNIEGVFTQDAGKSFVRRIVITFNSVLTEKETDALIYKIEHSGFKVADVENVKDHATH